MRPQRDDRREMIITGYQDIFANYCNLAGLATSTSCSLQNCSTEASHATFCKMLQDAAGKMINVLLMIADNAMAM